MNALILLLTACDADPKNSDTTDDTPYNFTLTDQFGTEVELYQFYGQVIVLDIFAEWCQPCQDSAPDGQELWEEYEDAGMVYIAVMMDANKQNQHAPVVLPHLCGHRPRHDHRQ